MITTSWGRVGR